MLRVETDSLPGGRLTKEQLRQQKDLDNARKAGTAPAAVDADGNAINPHIPTYITKAPWYAESGKGPSLAHQRIQKKDSIEPHLRIEQWYDRGAEAGPAAKKYRKGACENCGAMTHKRVDCVERPRKRGAKFTNQDIRPDEVVQSVARDYDAKRDRWNGYDPSSYKAIVEEFEAMEEARKKLREEEIDKQTSTDMAAVKKIAKAKQGDEDDEFGSSDEDDEDEDKYADAADAVGQKLDTKTRITVRNLRIREDTAKYLLNLNPDSAYYDPKTRSMRDAPQTGVAPEDLKFAGDNFHRYSGEATNMQKLQLFAWQSAQRGHDVNMHANPTAGERLHREFQEKREVLKETNKSSILERYGGEEHLERFPRELLSGQTEEYVEYSRTGKVIKGRERAVARSKYEEDVYTNNHTSVWGSWYDRDSRKWGFACCHSIIPQSYCTGEAGKAATQASATSALLASSSSRPAEDDGDNKDPPSRQTITSLADQHREALRKDKGKERAGTGAAPAGSDGDNIELDRTKLKLALEEEKKRRDMGEDEAWQNTKRSKTDVSQEELEAYRLSKNAFDDPMANYKDDM